MLRRAAAAAAAVAAGMVTGARGRARVAAAARVRGIGRTSVHSTRGLRRTRCATAPPPTARCARPRAPLSPPRSHPTVSRSPLRSTLSPTAPSSPPPPTSPAVLSSPPYLHSRSQSPDRDSPPRSQLLLVHPLLPRAIARSSLFRSPSLFYSPPPPTPSTRSHPRYIYVPSIPTGRTAPHSPLTPVPSPHSCSHPTSPLHLFLPPHMHTLRVPMASSSCALFRQRNPPPRTLAKPPPPPLPVPAVPHSNSGDHTVKLISVRTGECLRTLTGHRRTPWVVRFHPKDPNILASGSLDHEMGRCRLTGSKPVLKAPMVSALETLLTLIAFNVCFRFQLALLPRGAPLERRACRVHTLL